MNYEEEILQAISISILFATFLINTGRALNAIELCKGSLVLLRNKALSKEKQLCLLIYGKIYFIMFKVYNLVGDHTKAIACGWKRLTIHRELAQINQSKSTNAEAKKLFQKAPAISMEIGDREGEGGCYGNLETVFDSLGVYVNAKEFYERALAMSTEIGDREMEREHCLYT